MSRHREGKPIFQRHIMAGQPQHEHGLQVSYIQGYDDTSNDFINVSCDSNGVLFVSDISGGGGGSTTSNVNVVNTPLDVIIDSGNVNVTNTNLDVNVTNANLDVNVLNTNLNTTITDIDRGSVNVAVVKVDSITNTAINVRASALYIHKIQVMSVATNKGILGLYNASGDPGATDADFVVYFRGGNDNVVIDFPPGREIYYINGLSVRCQTASGALDLTNNNAVSANNVYMVVYFST